MGHVHATMNLSLDGCCDHTQVIADDEFHERISDLFEKSAALLFGRHTYELLQGHWPLVSSRGEGTSGELRLAGILDRKPKHVVSSRVPAPGWLASRTDATPDAIRTLSRDIDGILLLVGSPTLARTLVEWGLVAEYHVVLSPSVAGHGPRFLDGVSRPAAFSLREVTRLRSGVMFLRYGVDDCHGRSGLGTGPV